MSRWSSLVGGMKLLSSGVARITIGVATYSSNTVKEFFYHAYAIGSATCDMMYDPRILRVVQGMSYITVKQIVPLLALYFSNHKAQDYFHQLEYADNSWSNSYAASTLSLIDSGVQYYICRQGIETFFEMTFLQAVAPSEFTAIGSSLHLLPSLPEDRTAYKESYIFCENKKESELFYITDLGEPQKLKLYSTDLSHLKDIIASDKQNPLFFSASQIQKVIRDNDHKPRFKREAKSPVCLEHQCDLARNMKGSMIREPYRNFLNDLIIEAAKWIPEYGWALSLFLETMFYGSYITSAVTPERCDHHKMMMSESVLVIGLTYVASKRLMDYLLKVTLGEVPLLCHLVLSRLCLLRNIQIASSRTLPLVKPEEATLMIDPLKIYEFGCRFTVDTVIAGLQVTIPKYFPTNPDDPPLIPATTAFRFFTYLFKIGSKQEEESNVVVNATKEILLPSIFRSMNDLVNDPVIRPYWSDLQQFLANVLGTIVSFRDSKTKKLVLCLPKWGVTNTAYYAIGLPAELGGTLLGFAKEEDFWNFVGAFELWIGRHGVTSSPNFVSNPVMFSSPDEIASSVKEEKIDEDREKSAVAIPVKGVSKRGGDDGIFSSQQMSRFKGRSFHITGSMFNKTKASQSFKLGHREESTSTNSM